MTILVNFETRNALCGHWHNVNCLRLRSCHHEARPELVRPLLHLIRGSLVSSHILTYVGVEKMQLDDILPQVGLLFPLLKFVFFSSCCHTCLVRQVRHEVNFLFLQ